MRYGGRAIKSRVALTTNKPTNCISSLYCTYYSAPFLACLSFLSLPIWQGQILKYIPLTRGCASLCPDRVRTLPFLFSFPLALVCRPPLHPFPSLSPLPFAQNPRPVHRLPAGPHLDPRAASTVLYLTTATLPFFLSRISPTNLDGHRCQFSFHGLESAS
jgi:hypothetical protein